MNDIPSQNTGLLIGRRPSDYMGAELPYELRNKTGDWRKFLPVGEKQRPDAVDVMGCVTFSALSILEIQHIFQTGKEVNFSDRFTAKMSGTTHDGNWLYKVADSIRNDGVVWEKDYQTPANFSWDSYYAEIPQEVRTRAFKIIDKDNSVGWVFKKDFAYHLKQTPLHITIPEPYPNHAVVLVHISGDTGYYFDSYSPFLKTIKMSQISDAAQKIIYNAKPMLNVTTINIDGTIYVAHELNDPKDIPYANKFLGSNLVQNPDGTIPTDIHATKK